MTETLEIVQKTQLTPLKNDLFLGDAVAEFLFLKSYQIKPKSLKTYAESLNCLVDRFGYDCPVDQITEPDLIIWIESLKQTRKPSGVFQLWQTADFFFRWFYAVDLQQNPMNRIHLKRPKRDPIKGIEPAQVEKILKALDGSNRNRDRAIISVLFCSGLRKEEFCSLKMADVNTTTGAISASAEHAKRSKFRQIHIQGKSLLYLRRYIKQIPDPDPAAALWQSPAGKPLTASGIHEILKRSAKAAGLTDTFDFHDYRRGCALAMHRSGADIKMISHFLGHSDLKTTERYIALDDQDTARAAILFDPLK